MTHFSIDINYTIRAEQASTAALDELVTSLDGFHPAVSFTPRGWLSIMLTMPAEGTEQAVRAACAIASGPVARIDAAATIVRIEAMTEAEFDAREGFAHVPDLMGLPEAAAALGVSAQRARQMVDEGKFATARRVGERTWVVARSEVEAKAAKR